MRRIALLAVAVGALAAAATAWAVTNTLNYQVTLKKVAGKPTKKKPIRVAYNANLHIDTDPAGSQPDTAPITSIYFPSQIKQNAGLVPRCSMQDGGTSIPAKCAKAKVGTGHATALAGTPGAPASNSVKEDLNVSFYNGADGKTVLLVLNSEPTAPVAIQNRIVPGHLRSGTGPYGYRVDFEIPSDLQEQLGLRIALVDFKVNITNKAFTVRKGKKKVQVGYLELTSCGNLPIRAVGHFKDSANADANTDITDDSTAKAC